MFAHLPRHLLQVLGRFIETGSAEVMNGFHQMTETGARFGSRLTILLMLHGGRRARVRARRLIGALARILCVARDGESQRDGTGKEEVGVHDIDKPGLERMVAHAPLRSGR
jgi:hypothetical protein